MKRISLRNLLKNVAAKPKEVALAVKDPLKRFKVQFDSYRVWCAKPTGEVSVIEWKRLTTILYDSMPGHAGTLNLWVLQGIGQLCVIPEGALGLDDLIAKLQKIPGFKMPEEGEAKQDGDRITITCWKKPEKPAPAGA